MVKSNINSVEICGNVKYIMADGLYFDFLLPETLKGAEIICRDGEYHIEYNDLSVTFQGEKLPFNMVCKALETCVNNVQGATPEIDAINQQLIYTYNAENHICKLYTEIETKHFLRLSIDGEDVLIFENFEYVGQTEQN